MVYDNGMMGRRDFPELPANGQQQRLAFSDDGVRWKGSAEPIFRGQSDTHNNVCYNEERGVLMLYRRAPINAGEIRRIAYSESANLIDWTQPRVIVSPDELDAHSLYGMTVSRYQGVYIGFLQQFYLADPLGGGMKPGKHMMVDVQLAWSRDGLNWSRHPGRPIFLETGPVGSYDWGMVYVGKVSSMGKVIFLAIMSSFSLRRIFYEYRINNLNSNFICIYRESCGVYLIFNSELV